MATREAPVTQDSKGMPILLGDRLESVFHDIVAEIGKVESNGLRALMRQLDLRDLNGEDLSGADLSGQDLSGLQFRRVRFVETNCSGTNFRDADLRHADFTGALLKGANFHGARTYGALGIPTSALARKAQGLQQPRHRVYEHVFLARQDLAQEEVEALTEAAARIVHDHDGEVTKTEAWGLRTLAYRIAKNRKAHFVMLEIDAPADAIVELERKTLLNEDVIRYMTIRVDQPEPGPSAMIRQSRPVGTNRA